ncbi:MAG: STAS domain-containing protein [Oscillospiraceae bacterium]|nr:STAS domain-containing protein [Oscillospiraceae bacterium]
MNISRKQKGDELTVSLEGRLDTNTASDLEQEFESSINNSVKKLILDFTKLAYISSAGLRVVLMAKKKMIALSGDISIFGANDAIIEVFQMTGFLDILTLEN